MLPVEKVRARLKQVLRRPLLPPGSPAASLVSAETAAPPQAGEDVGTAIVWERWVAHSEPGPQGRVPVLVARPRASNGRRPALLVLHGTLKVKEDMAEHLARYAKQGYVAVSFDSRYRGERGSVQDYQDSLVAAWRHNFRGPEAQAPAAGDEHPFIFDSAWDVSRVIDMLVAREDVDPDRVGATGVSLGGMIVWFAAAADERLAAAAPSIGVQGFRFAVEREIWHARVDTIRPVFEAAASDLKENAITSNVVDQVWRRILPGIMDELDAPSSLRCIAPRPLLVINGEMDPRCPVEGVRLAFQSAFDEYCRCRGSDAKHLQLHIAAGVEHEVTQEMWDVIDDFLARHLQPQKAGASAAAVAAPRSRL